VTSFAVTVYPAGAKSACCPRQLLGLQASDDNLPIGSGVTEAACKTLVKQRLGGAGMRWTPRGAHVVLQLRAAALTNNRWNAFWRKISSYGVKIEADCAA
jgi:hypothetical protein